MNDSQTDFKLLKILHHNQVCTDSQCLLDGKRSVSGSDCWKYFIGLPIEQYLELVTGHFRKSCLDRPLSWWTCIKEKTKRFEGRIPIKIWKWIRPGHLITFFNEDQQEVTIRVVKIHPHASYGAAYSEHLNQLIPKSVFEQAGLPASPESADQIYAQLLLPAYGNDKDCYQQTIAQHGVIAIEMEKLD
jgi:ASC-1-like (ASCH) protein